MNSPSLYLNISNQMLHLSLLYVVAKMTQYMYKG